MPYCTATDVRLLTGVQPEVLSDSDIESLITFSDQQITDELEQTFSAPVPTRIKRLSALLTAIQVYSRPDLRFRLGQAGVDEQQITRNIQQWRSEADTIINYYLKAGKKVRMV